MRNRESGSSCPQRRTPPSRTNPAVESSPRQLRGRPGLRINNPALQLRPSRNESSAGRGPEFCDTAPEKVHARWPRSGLGKWALNDIVTAFRPIYLDEHGKEVLGDQHGKVNGQTIRVKAKKGYAVVQWPKSVALRWTLSR